MLLARVLLSSLEYQHQAAEAFYQSGHVQGGSGVIALPCGAGKTIVGMAAMVAVKEYPHPYH